jgi:predicted  nucleic acid-binding Zn-ribbon protein
LQKSLKLLVELQEIDLKADGLRGEKEAVLAEVSALEQKLQDVRDALAAKQEELGSLLTEKEELEQNLATETENIVRSETRLKDIKTQKEYQAVSKEISSAKKLKGELEEQLLQKIGRLDDLRGETSAMESDIKALEANTAAQKTVLEDGVARLEQEITADLIVREAKVKGLPASVMKRYATLRIQRKGVAVVEAREGSCIGCNMQLPPQLYNLLFRGEELITCPHCHRVLVLKQD